MKRLILCFFMLMFSSGILWADGVTFEATVNSAQVSLDEVMQLTLTFTGVNDNLNPVSLPVIDGFTAKYMGPSSSESFVFVNGKSESHSERSFIYNLFPNKVGHFQIPPISATIAGHTYTTNPIDIEVLSGSAQAPSSPSDTDDHEDIRLVASVDKTDVYLNQRIPLTIKFLVHGVPIQDIQYPQFDKTGFTVDDFEKPQQGSQIVNGVNYDEVIFKTNIYPDHPGDITLGPVQIQVNVRYKTGQENPFNQDNNFFGADVFNNFFDTYTTRPVTRASRPIQLHVSSLPQENRPQDFSGAIGQFDFQAGVSPLQVKAGDPLTLKMDLKGSGNFKNVQMPVFQAAGFKTYEPQIKNGADEKTAEEVIIPTSTDIKEVPAINFSYFDPELKDYRTITQGPFPVHVTAPAPDEQFKAVGFTDLTRGPSALASNQFSWGKFWNKIQRGAQKIFRSLWFWLIFICAAIAGAAYYFWRRFQKRLQTDPAFARRLKAVKEARQALVGAQGYIAAGKPKDFYALISKVLRDFLANKWHQSSAALSVERIITLLKSAGIDEAHITQIKTILDVSDLVCFAGANRDAAQMKADLAQTHNLIDYLQQHLK